MNRDEEAGELWNEVYGQLTRDRVGLYGAVTSRAEAHTLRLSCLYALLDRSADVRVPHLAAALEVWRYCEDSCRFIFGDSLGDITADDDSCRPSAQSGWLDAHGNQPASLIATSRPDQVTRALELLRSQKMAEFKSRPTKGRPAERWFAT